MRPVVVHGDATTLPLAAQSVDAIVCDPPYELAFMAKDWDSAGVAFDPQTWAEAFRVLKPGGYLLAFGGSRTWHRLACAIEDAGFELRDSICWLYGSGFPKSLNLDGDRKGWGTALKPAFEPIVVARKPLIGTVAANVQQHGTGALNIDATRVAHGADVDLNHQQRQQSSNGSIEGAFGAASLIGQSIPTYKPGGRWPANVVLSHAATCLEGDCEPGCPVAELDQQSGTLKSWMAPSDYAIETREEIGPQNQYGDSGGASRFFPTFRYQAKAPSRERPVGPDGVKHPTCKPLDLMRWLVRLITPPGGLILDPFAGSGTTLEAAQLEGFRVVGVEKHAPYLPLIEQRIERSTPTPAAEGAWTLFGDVA